MSRGAPQHLQQIHQQEQIATQKQKQEHLITRIWLFIFFFSMGAFLKEISFFSSVHICYFFLHCLPRLVSLGKTGINCDRRNYLNFCTTSGFKLRAATFGRVYSLCSNRSGFHLISESAVMLDFTGCITERPNRAIHKPRARRI